MIKNSNNFIIIALVALSISVIFSLVTITSIETTYANHTKSHFNNSLVDVTISGDDIPDALLEDIKRNIAMKAEQKAFDNNNNSQLQTQTVETTKKAKIILTGQKYIENDESNYDDINGQVKNIGNGTAESIKTVFTFYDSNGNMVGTDYVYIDVDRLNPGQKAPFSIMVDKRELPDMAHYEVSLSWNNPDGIEEYMEDVEVINDSQQKLPIIENTDEKSESENLPFLNRDNTEIETLSEDEENREEDEEDEDDDDDDEDNDN
jgi:hypothetical protein